MKTKVFVAIAILFFASMLVSNLAAAETVNATLLENQAAVCINDSKLIMQSMIEAGFNVLSINDTLYQAENAFSAQELLKQRAGKYDFNIVINYCNTIEVIQEDALIAKDNFDSLLRFYNDSKKDAPGMDTTTIEPLITEIQGDIDNERFTEVQSVVDAAYTEITRVKSSYTALNIFYQSTTTGIMSFLMARNGVISIPGVIEIKNWQLLLGLFIILLVAFLIYRVKIVKYMLNKKLEKLMNRKKTIKGLIMQTQKGYFQYGTIPEGEYNIKTKRFAELIRDIDRQIPIVEEDIIKLGGGSKSLRQNQGKEFELMLEENSAHEDSETVIPVRMAKEKEPVSTSHERRKLRSHKKTVRKKKKY